MHLKCLTVREFCLAMCLLFIVCTCSYFLSTTASPNSLLNAELKNGNLSESVSHRNSFIPVHYDVDIRLKLSKSLEEPWNEISSSSANVTIHCKAIRDTFDFHLEWMGNANPIQIKVYNVTSNRTVKLQISKLSANGNIYSVRLNHLVNAGDLLQITISCQIPSNKFKPDDYLPITDENLVAFFQPWGYKEKTIPALLDSENNRVTHDLKVEVEGLGSRSIVSSLEQDFIVQRDNVSEIHFKKSPPLHMHHVAFFICDFIAYNYSTSSSSLLLLGNSTNLTVWVQPNTFNESFINYTGQAAALLLNYYNQIFGVEYPKNNLNIVLTPTPKYFHPLSDVDYNSFGTIFAQSYPDEVVSKDDKEMNMFTFLSKKIAQQWFEVVTSSKNGTSALNGVPLSELVGYHWATPKLFPRENSDWLIISSGDERLKIIEGIINRTTLENGLRSYIKNWKWKDATEQDFLNSIQTEIEQNNQTELFPPGVTLHDVMDIPSNHILDVPIVKFDLAPNSTVIVSQPGFGDSSDGYSPRWLPLTITVKYKNGSRDDRNLWLPKNGSSVLLEDLSEMEMILGNRKRRFSYRTIYDMPLIKMLSSQLQENFSEFDLADRKMLFQDHVDLLQWSGDRTLELSKNSLERIFELAKYMDKESDLFLWNYLLDRTMYHINFYFFHGNDEAFHLLRKYFQPKLNSLILNHSGLENIPVTGNTMITKMCLLLDVPMCLKDAVEKVEQWKQNISSLPPATNWAEENKQSEIMCGALIYEESNSKSKSTWDFILDRFFKDGLFNQVEERSKYFVKVLACTRNDARFEAVLESTLKYSWANELLTLAFDLYLGHSAEFTFASERRLRVVANFAKRNLLNGRISQESFSAIISTLCNVYAYGTKADGIEFFEDIKRFLQSIEEPNSSGYIQRLAETISYSESCKTTDDYYCHWWDTQGNNLLDWLRINAND